MNERMQQLWSSRKHRRPRRAQEEAAATGGGTPPAPPPAATKPGRGRVAFVLLLCLVGSAVVSFFVFKATLSPNVPPELVGTWKVTQGKLKGATLEFRSDGTSIATLDYRGFVLPRKPLRFGLVARALGARDVAVGGDVIRPLAFHQAIALRPDHAASHCGVGVILWRKGQLDEAIHEHRIAINLDPKSALAHNNLGIVLENKGQREEAIRERSRQ